MIAALAMISLSPIAHAGVTIFEDGESKLKVSTLIRVDAIKSQSDTVIGGVAGKNDTQGLDLNRTYLTFKYTINPDWMLRLTTDVKYESTLAKKSNVFVKYAYLQGKLAGDAAVLRLGVSHTPWIDHELALWKHAYIIDEASSTFGYEASSDLSVGLKGKLADGMVNYWVAAVNGKGYTNIKKTNGMDFTGRIGINPIKGLTMDVGYRTGYKGTKTSATPALGKQNLTRFMVTYGADSYRIGADYMINKDKTIASPTKDTLYSVWGWLKLGSGFGVVARLDSEKSNTINVISADQRTKQYVAGITYSPAKKVNFALVYNRKKFDSYKYVAADTRKDTKIGLWAQFAY